MFSTKKHANEKNLEVLQEEFNNLRKLRRELEKESIQVKNNLNASTEESFKESSAYCFKLLKEAPRIVHISQLFHDEEKYPISTDEKITIMKKNIYSENKSVGLSEKRLLLLKKNLEDTQEKIKEATFMSTPSFCDK